MPNEELVIYYPSGNVFRIFGRFVKHGKLRRGEDARYGVAVENLESVVLGNENVSSGSISLLDPRCVVVGEKSGIIYSPRPYMQHFPSEIREWMERNPSWPSQLDCQRERSGLPECA